MTNKSSMRLRNLVDLVSGYRKRISVLLQRWRGSDLSEKEIGSSIRSRCFGKLWIKILSAQIGIELGYTDQTLFTSTHHEFYALPVSSRVEKSNLLVQQFCFTFEWKIDSRKKLKCKLLQQTKTRIHIWLRLTGRAKWERHQVIRPGEEQRSKSTRGSWVHMVCMKRRQ